MRKFLVCACLIILSLGILTSCGKKKNVLYIYNWSDYMSPVVLANFEKEYNCTIVMDYFDSNEAMYAKLKLDDRGYDLIIPSSYMAAVMKKEGMIVNIDKSKLPNLKYISNKYSIKTEDPDMIYSLPYCISFTGLAYDKNRVGNIKATWGVFGDKAYYHKISMFNDMREAIGSALKYLGYSLNTIDDNQLSQAEALMLKWKKNIATYQNDDAKTSLSDGILSVIQAYNGDGIQLHNDNHNLDFIVPEEGTSIGVDDMVIPKDAKNPELAYKFINFLYEPKNCADHMKFIDYICPNDEAIKLLPPDFVKRLMIPENILKKSEVIRDLGDNNLKYIKIWNAIKIS